MIVVLLLTVLSPGYAWEAAARTGQHGETSAGIDAHGPGEHGQPESLDPAQNDQAPHDLHGCAGHILGHLVAVIDSAHGVFPSDARADHVFGRDTSSPSRYPVPLDHPPRVVPLA